VRVLHVNKFGHTAGGVETHVRDLIEMQSAEGDEVSLFTADDVPGEGFTVEPQGARGRFRVASHLLWSRTTARSLRRRLEEFEPEVIHFHGIYHQLSPSVLWEARRQGIPSVMTLHDYKMVAPCYLLLRDGETCTACVGKRLPIAVVRHRCIRSSVAASALCSVEQFVHRPAYSSWVDLYVVPSAHARDQIVAGRAVDPGKVRVVPHGVALPPPSSRPQLSRTVLYFGRLAPEKGVEDLLAAWKHAALPEPWSLEIAGTGPLEGSLRAEAPSGVRFLGHLGREETAVAVDRAFVVAAPSRFPETFGLSVAEAMAAGRATLVSAVGNLPDLVGSTGVVLPPGDVKAWAAALVDLSNQPDAYLRLGGLARSRIATQFSAELAQRRVNQVYKEVCAGQVRPRSRASVLA
jgi:glycosyltransferase involved in cell wall biosynthesis